MTAIIYFGEMLAASLLAVVLMAISQLGMNYEALLFASDGVRGHEPPGVFCFQKMPRQDCGIAMRAPSAACGAEGLKETAVPEPPPLAISRE